MRKNKRWASIGCFWVLGWLAPLGPLHGQTATTTRGGMVWYGDWNQWTWTDNDSMPGWQLDAQEPGIHTLWGCPASPSNADTTGSGGFWRWRQGVAGSANNRSSWRWVHQPLEDPDASAEALFQWDEAGWLDESMGMAAGETGSDDPLRCWAPASAAWDVLPTCHAWANPFDLQGSFWLGDDGHWVVEAHDEHRRSLRCIDTSFASIDADASLCVGWRVKCTTSNLSGWAFAWQPVPEETVTPWVSETGESVSSWEASIDGLGELQMQSWPPSPNAPFVKRLGRHASTPIPESEGCNNAWHCPIDPPLPLGEFTQFVVGNDTLDLWVDGAARLEPGDLAFTEIMADPTPALAAPEATYLEVLNASPWVIDPTSILLHDNGQTHELEPVDEIRPWMPWQRMVLADDPEAFEASGGVGCVGMLVKVRGWPGLRDDGERVSLMRGIDTLETVEYNRSWWANDQQGGRSISIQVPEGCDDIRNWSPDPQGASPGCPSWLETMHPDGCHQSDVVLRLNPDGFIEFLPDPPWDARSPVAISMSDADGVHEGFLASKRDQGASTTWVFEHVVSPGNPIRLTSGAIPSCLCPNIHASLDTVWVPYRQPRVGEIVATEVLPTTHPTIQAEFVEWTNVTKDTLSWHGQAWYPGHCLVQSNMDSTEFRRWLGDEWTVALQRSLWQIDPSFQLSNSGGSVALIDDWQLPVATVNYSECGHSCPEYVDSGRSMELRDDDSGTTWHTCFNRWGMSPGLCLTEHGRPSMHQGHAATRHGILEDRWAFIPESGADSTWLHADWWWPSTQWSWTWHQGIPVLLANWGPSDWPHVGPEHLLNPDWSFPDQLGRPSASESNVTFTEWLQSPSDCHAPFLEVVADDDQSTADWHWTTSEHAEPSDFVPVGHAEWWMPSGLATCLASCPNWVEHRPDACLPANLPSLHGDRILSFTKPGHTSQLAVSAALHSPWVQDDEGHSMTLVNRLNLWTTTPAHLGSTPGEHDPRLQGDTLARAKGLQCTPQTLQPGSQTLQDWVRAAWVSDDPNATFDVTWSVRAWDRQGVVVASHAHNAVGNVAWVWRGNDHLGNLVPSGQYILEAAWQGPTMRTIRRSRCLITVSPP